MDFARFQGWSDKRFRKITEILLEARNVDEAAEVFIKLKKRSSESESYRIVTGKEAMLILLHEGGELNRELNGDKFLMKKG